MHWEEWDGEGMEHAVAWTPGLVYDDLTIRKAVHRLGIEFEGRKERLAVVHGFVTDTLSEDIIPYGYTENVKSSIPATFVFIVPVEDEEETEERQ